MPGQCPVLQIFKPGQGGNIVLIYTASEGIHYRQAVLTMSVSLFCSLGKQSDCLLIIRGDGLIHEIHQSQIKLGIHLSTVCRHFPPVSGFLIILLDAVTAKVLGTHLVLNSRLALLGRQQVPVKWLSRSLLLRHAHSRT